MPFTSVELTHLGYVSLDSFMRNNPIDQVAVERPLLRKILNAGGKPFAGGKQYVVEQIRHRYDSNFQFYFGAATVSYKKKDTVRQTNFTWGSMHDGFYLDEDTLLANGVTINDDMPKSATNDERVQLTALLEENLETLRLGFEEQWSLNSHQDGTQDADAIAGLDHLIQLDPTSAGTVGGIDQAANSYWRNNFSLDIAQADLIDTMETEWRNCIRNGGRPNCIIAGSTFVDTFRAAATASDVIQRYTILSTQGQSVQLDPSVTQGDMGTSTGLHFQGVPIIWSPEFETLDSDLAPAQEWESRCYFINSKHLKWRPARGHNMVSRKPMREHNRYVWYWALTNKGVFTTNRRNAHAVLTVTGA